MCLVPNIFAKSEVLDSIFIGNFSSGNFCGAHWGCWGALFILRFSSFSHSKRSSTQYTVSSTYNLLYLMLQVLLSCLSNIISFLRIFSACLCCGVKSLTIEQFFTTFFSFRYDTTFSLYWSIVACAQRTNVMKVWFFEFDTNEILQFIINVSVHLYFCYLFSDQIWEYYFLFLSLSKFPTSIFCL